MADALASGASGSNTVWVQVPSPALERRVGRKTYPFFLDNFDMRDKIIKKHKEIQTWIYLRKFGHTHLALKML